MINKCGIDKVLPKDDVIHAASQYSPTAFVSAADRIFPCPTFRTKVNCATKTCIYC